MYFIWFCWFRTHVSICSNIKLLMCLWKCATGPSSKSNESSSHFSKNSLIRIPLLTFRLWVFKAKILYQSVLLPCMLYASSILFYLNWSLQYVKQNHLWSYLLGSILSDSSFFSFLIHYIKTSCINVMIFVKYSVLLPYTPILCF
jgi:hypothetical protein